MRPCGQAKGQDDLFRSRLDQIMTKAHSLPAASRTQVNVFLKDATRSGKWHANYSWLTKPVVVDPTQAIKCRALPTEARAVVDDVLQYGYESRAELRKTLEEELSADKDQARALQGDWVNQEVT